MKVKGGRHGHIRLSLDDGETLLLRNLIEEMQMMLQADIPRTDPVKERLFPRAYEDPDNEETFRDLTSSDLENAKLEALRVVRDSLGDRGGAQVDLGPDEVGSWLRLLTDLRLAIGVRLDVTEEIMSAEVDPDDPNAPALSVLHWLGWVQGSILERMEG